MFKHFKTKAKLNNAFKVADISHTIHHNNSIHKRYPSILEIRENDQYLQYTFKIPPGMPPKDFLKKEHVISQFFGTNYELKGDGLIYVLKLFKTEQNKTIKYNYDEIKPYLKGSLPILAGYDQYGKFYSYDGSIHPHLLIAGETGSGKSVMIRAIITTFILHFGTDLELHLCDLKRSEFHLFRHCHNVSSVMTKKSELKNCLTYLKKELKVRGDLCDAYEVSHIENYNKIKGVDKKNKIVLCIDEVALLKKDNDIMDIVEEISCIGRSLNITLILSMQRPDAKLLDGQLKNNLTVRFAFRHSDKINSDITLGRGTTENAGKISIEDKGKFYFKSESILLLQAPYLDMEEAKELLEPYKIRPHVIVDAEIINYNKQQNSDFEPLPVLKEESKEDDEST